MLWFSTFRLPVSKNNLATHPYLHSVPRIVALKTVCANTGEHANVHQEHNVCPCVCILAHAHAIFTQLKMYYNARALIFLKFLQLKNQVNQLNMQTKFFYQYF